MLQKCLDLISHNQQLCNNMKAFRFEASLLVKLSAANTSPPPPCLHESAIHIELAKGEDQQPTGYRKEEHLQQEEEQNTNCDLGQEEMQQEEDVNSLSAHGCGEWEGEELCESVISRLCASPVFAASVESEQEQGRLSQIARATDAFLRQRVHAVPALNGACSTWSIAVVIPLCRGHDALSATVRRRSRVSRPRTQLITR